MTKISRSTIVKVRKYLKSIYGKRYADVVTEIDNTFIVRRGSAAVNITVNDWHKDDCLVRAMAYVVQGAKVGPKLMSYLLRENETLPLGAFGLLFDDTVTFGHTIAGANMDENEFRMTVATVAYLADHYDDIIMKMAGGQRAVDAGANLIFEIGPAISKKRKSKSTSSPSSSHKSRSASKAMATKKSSSAMKKAGAAKKKASPKKKATKKVAPKKTTAKKATKTKKTVAKKTTTKKKAAPKKKTVAKKAATKKKAVTKKKAAPKKKAVTKKKAAPKKKAVTKKKTAPKKKTTSKKKATKK